MSRYLYIAAKAPRPGLAKTRLGKAIGHGQAAALYRAFLCDLAARFAGAPFEVGWYVTPPDAWSEIAAAAHWSERPAHIIYQGPGDWTERQRQFFRHVFDHGQTPALLIASDAPQIPATTIVAAFDALDRHDLVFGPGYDGGYYLIGMRRWHDVLAGVPMSTPAVLHAILARARAAGLSVAQVAPAFDVDEVGDLDRLLRWPELARELPATHAALVQLGLLVSERVDG